MNQFNHKKNEPTRLLVYLVFLIVTNLTAATLPFSYEFSVGDMAAIQLSLYAQAAWITTIRQYDIGLLAVYDKMGDRILIDIYGTSDRVETAQETIEKLLSLLDYDYIPYLKKIKAIELKNDDVKIIYRNRNEEGAKKILIWEKGKFKFPINE